MNCKVIKILLLVFILSFSYRAIASTVEDIGDTTQILLPISAVAITGFHKDLNGFKQFAYSFVLTEGTVQLLKHTIHRERPNGTTKSFPSGHTAASFVSASFLQFRYGYKYGIPAYVVAGFTGYSRIQAKKHWVSDVLAGAAIGTGFAYIFTKPYSNLTIEPYYNGENNSVGASISLK